MRAVIFANGEMPDVIAARRVLQPGDYVIAADGGTRHALSAGVVPDVIVGDMDSLTPAERERAERGGAQFRSFPARKDETDLELALGHAVDAGAERIVVLAALGGRLDQTIANVFLLTLPGLRGIDVRIVQGGQTASVIDRSTGVFAILGRPGDTVSLIPLGGDACGVTAVGLEWPLNESVLRFGPARGVSNVLTGEQAKVSVRSGRLLCVVTEAAAAE
jgi:thiamine pyrophosphokinase